MSDASQHTISQMERVYTEALDLARSKNADYGDAWRENGWRGNIARIFEKARRMRNILWNGGNAAHLDRETTRETAIDMINTLAFFVINHDSGVEWGHETPFAPTMGTGIQMPEVKPLSQIDYDAQQKQGNPDATRYAVPVGTLRAPEPGTQRGMDPVSVPVPGNDDHPSPRPRSGTQQGKRKVVDQPQG